MVLTALQHSTTKSFGLLIALLLSTTFITHCCAKTGYNIAVKVGLGTDNHEHPQLGHIAPNKVFQMLQAHLLGKDYAYQGFASSTGTVQFLNVQPGIYILQIQSIYYAFPFYWLYLDLKGEMRVLSLDNSSIPVVVSPVIQALWPLNYFQATQSLGETYKKMLSSPLVILILAGVGMLGCINLIGRDTVQEMQREVRNLQGGKSPQEQMPHLLGELGLPKTG